jgi:hypothetical protein
LRNVRTSQFRELFATLPSRIRELAVDAYALFLENPEHPSLRYHKLADSDNLRSNSYSVSITMRYRAVCTIDGETRVWYWIGTHADYDRLVG